MTLECNPTKTLDLKLSRYTNLKVDGLWLFHLFNFYVTKLPVLPELYLDVLLSGAACGFYC